MPKSIQLFSSQIKFVSQAVLFSSVVTPQGKGSPRWISSMIYADSLHQYTLEQALQCYLPCFPPCQGVASLEALFVMFSSAITFSASHYRLSQQSGCFFFKFFIYHYHKKCENSCASWVITLLITLTHGQLYVLFYLHLILIQITFKPVCFQICKFSCLP